MKYTPYKIELIYQWAETGSKWYRGNFNIGLMVDNHPRFTNIILGFWWFEIGIGFTREAIGLPTCTPDIGYGPGGSPVINEETK